MLENAADECHVCSMFHIKPCIYPCLFLEVECVRVTGSLWVRRNDFMFYIPSLEIIFDCDQPPPSRTQLLVRSLQCTYVLQQYFEQIFNNFFKDLFSDIFQYIKW